MSNYYTMQKNTDAALERLLSQKKHWDFDLLLDALRQEENTLSGGSYVKKVLKAKIKKGEIEQEGDKIKVLR